MKATDIERVRLQLSQFPFERNVWHSTFHWGQQQCADRVLTSNKRTKTCSTFFFSCVLIIDELRYKRYRMHTNSGKKIRIEADVGQIFYFILNVRLSRTLHPSFDSHVHAAFIRITLALKRNTSAALVCQAAYDVNVHLWISCLFYFGNLRSIDRFAAATAAAVLKWFFVYCIELSSLCFTPNSNRIRVALNANNQQWQLIALSQLNKLCWKYFNYS